MAEYVDTNKQYYYKLFKDYLYNSANNCSDLNSKDIIYINQSNIHGIGLFAKKDINENELITLYPAHIIEIIGQNKVFRLTCINEYRMPYKIQYRNDYAIKYDNNSYIIGNPILKENKNFVGHLCNDGYKHNFITKNKKNKNKYNKKRLELNNASFRDIINPDFIGMGIISNKNIKKDEEILVSYGFDYWLKRNELSISN
jgi:SET domain-containing protein